MSERELCTMYISTFHLITLLIPYIDEKTKENQDLIIINERDVSDKFCEYLNNVKGMYSYNFRYNNVEFKAKTEIDEEINDKNVILIGSEEFINNTREKYNFSSCLDCYRVLDIVNITNIYDKYRGVLRTGGKIEDKIFSQKGHEKEILST